MGRHKKYETEEERKEAQKEYKKKYYETHKDSIKEKQKEYNREYYKKYYQTHKEYYSAYYNDNKEEKIDYQNKWRKTKLGRANDLLSGYKKADKNQNRGECDFDAKWIVDNIFASKCIYCGEDDWTKLGCDRIDNDLPHIKNNVVPCCGECNIQKQKKSFEEFIAERSSTNSAYN